MTAIVGFLCQDGAVIGADSAATSAADAGATSIRTIEQEVKKLCVIGDRVIVAGTGSVGLGQRFCEEVRQFHDAEKGFGRLATASACVVELCKRGVANFGGTGAQKGEYGALIAFSHGGKPHLVEFAVKDFQPNFEPMIFALIRLAVDS